MGNVNNRMVEHFAHLGKAHRNEAIGLFFAGLMFIIVGAIEVSKSGVAHTIIGSIIGIVGIGFVFFIAPRLLIVSITWKRLGEQMLEREARMIFLTALLEHEATNASAKESEQQ